MIASGWTYRRVSHGRPCAVCGKDHWCRFGVHADGRVVSLCNRIASDRPARGEGGGWLHHDTAGRPAAFRLASAKPEARKLSSAELTIMHQQFVVDLLPARRATLAEQLHVSDASLRALGIGWSVDRRAFTFPMRSANGTLVGIRLRHADGSKTCWTGSRLGIVFPNFGQKGNPHGLTDVLLVAEGESDAAAAALDLGFAAIGRPGCGVCAADVLAYVGIIRPPRVVLLADADEPGQRGAHALARRLAAAGHACRVLTLPDGAKDLRAWKLLPESNTHVLAALIDAPADRIEDCNDSKS